MHREVVELPTLEGLKRNVDVNLGSSLVDLAVMGK